MLEIEANAFNKLRVFKNNKKKRHELLDFWLRLLRRKFPLRGLFYT